MFSEETLEKFTVRIGNQFRMEDYPTVCDDDILKKREGKELLRENTLAISDFQHVMYAQNAYSLLVVLQAMDAAGKDSTIRRVFSGVNPQGCRVWNFKQPSGEELKHDFLWRCFNKMPERGHIAVFNRSYYEEVIVVQVHPELIVSQGKTIKQAKNSAFWVERYDSIVGLERHMQKHGTRVIKFFLHLSKEEQGRRILARVQNRDKMWKFSKSDISERKLWDDYQQSYQHCISNTATQTCPWYVIPADRKWYARAMISQIIRREMEGMGLDWPQISEDKVTRLKESEKQLRKELGIDS